MGSLPVNRQLDLDWSSGSGPFTPDTNCQIAANLPKRITATAHKSYVFPLLHCQFVSISQLVWTSLSDLTCNCQIFKNLFPDVVSVQDGTYLAAWGSSCSRAPAPPAGSSGRPSIAPPSSPSPRPDLQHKQGQDSQLTVPGQAGWETSAGSIPKQKSSLEKRKVANLRFASCSKGIVGSAFQFPQTAVASKTDFHRTLH